MNTPMTNEEVIELAETLDVIKTDIGINWNWSIFRLQQEAEIFDKVICQGGREIRGTYHVDGQYHVGWR